MSSAPPIVRMASIVTNLVIIISSLCGLAAQPHRTEGANDRSAETRIPTVILVPRSDHGRAA
jgi:hypothetical protein